MIKSQPSPCSDNVSSACGYCGVVSLCGHAFDGSFFLFISLGSPATATIRRTNFTSFSCKQLGRQERQDGIIYTQQLPIRGLPTLYTVVCVSMELPLCCAVMLLRSPLHRWLVVLSHPSPSSTCFFRKLKPKSLRNTYRLTTCWFLKSCISATNSLVYSLVKYVQFLNLEGLGLGASELW